eukprot:4319082-Ditylum_brightwellii.AAC.1
MNLGKEQRQQDHPLNSTNNTAHIAALEKSNSSVTGEKKRICLLCAALPAPIFTVMHIPSPLLHLPMCHIITMSGLMRQQHTLKMMHTLSPASWTRVNWYMVM